jgi:hypothetical protein
LTSDAATIEGWDHLHFHFFPEKNMRLFRTMRADLIVHDESPSLVEIHKGVTTQGIFNGATKSGVYDSECNLVASSTRIRGTNEFVDREIDRTALLNPYEDGRDTYFLGRGVNHYGHFVLETLSRAWAWQEHGKGLVPIIQAPMPRFARALYALIPNLSEQIELVKRPTRFHQILVPGAAFIIAHKAHVTFKKLCDRMAGQTAASREAMTEQPLYLSRAGLGSVDRRTLEGEHSLEGFLESEGFLVVRPERLPIEEQIILFNRHRWIVSPMGSACHTRLFSCRPTNLIMLTSSYFNPNYALCDLLCEGASHYVNVFARPDIGAGVRLPGFVEPVVLESDRLVATLKEFGLVRASATFDQPPLDIIAYKQKWLEAARSQLKRKGGSEQTLLRAIDEIVASFNS